MSGFRVICFAIRDSIFGDEFRETVKAIGIEEVLFAPRSPWQRAYVERVIGTIRRECLDHVIVFNEASLKGYLKRSWRIITNRGRTSRWAKTRRQPDQFKISMAAGSSQCRRWAAYITGTNGSLRR